MFFENVIIEATVQFVEEHQEAVRQLNAGLEPTVADNAEFVQRITLLLREPLGPLLLGLEVLLREEALSPRGVEMIGVLQRGVKKEARAIEELLRSTDLFEKDAVQRDMSGFVGSDCKGDFQRISPTISPAALRKSFSPSARKECRTPTSVRRCGCSKETG